MHLPPVTAEKGTINRSKTHLHVYECLYRYSINIYFYLIKIQTSDK